MKQFLGKTICVIAIVLVAPTLVLLLLTLLLVLLLLFSVYFIIRRTIAIATITGDRRWLLYQLWKIGSPPLGVLMGHNEEHCHTSACTLQTCVYMRAEEYWRLVDACKAHHVLPWRIRWAA